MVNYGMTWVRTIFFPSLHFIPCLVIPCLAAGLLLAPRTASAQLVVTGPPGPASAALSAWYGRHVPARFRAKEQFEVYPMTESRLASYLQNAGRDGNSDQSSHSDDGSIDGIFEDNPPRITLLVPEKGAPDLFTFAHEYGHYVWYDILSKDDRSRYEGIYKKQKSARHLVTRYAEADTEEGFAEAFSFYAAEPSLLHRRDGASYQFLAQWTAPFPNP